VQQTSNAQYPTPNVEWVCDFLSPTTNPCNPQFGLILRVLAITWRQEMTKEPAGDKKDDAGCSAEG